MGDALEAQLYWPQAFGKLGTPGVADKFASTESSVVWPALFECLADHTTLWPPEADQT